METYGGFCLPPLLWIKGPCMHFLQNISGKFIFDWFTSYLHYGRGIGVSIYNSQVLTGMHSFGTPPPPPPPPTPPTPPPPPPPPPTPPPHPHLYEVTIKKWASADHNDLYLYTVCGWLWIGDSLFLVKITYVTSVVGWSWRQLNHAPQLKGMYFWGR